MTPTGLDDGDPGELGGVFDTITGTVTSIERFGDTLGEATSFSMTTAMIWAVILFMFFTLVARLARPWSDAGADRYRNDRPIIPRHPGGRVAPSQLRIEELEEKLAAALQRILELEEAQPELKEVERV